MNKSQRWRCKDRRYNLRRINSTSTPVEKIWAQCRWDETYVVLPSELECILTYCAHPHDYPHGSHDRPPSNKNINLVTPSGSGWSTEGWHVEFGTKITYKCDSGKHFELPVPSEVDPTHDTLKVECLNTGVYNTPILQGEVWPNCTQTVNCGPPLPHPVNGRINGTDGHDGAITWLNNATNQDTYGTTVEYKCADGSQFDTTSNGQGDTPTIRTRCQWDKTWSAPASLPPCYVTHCIHPYPIPEDTFLQEITSAWTLVNQKKQYECKGKIGGVHTRFWEADRSKSTFEILCLPDGTFSFDNLRESWPTCIEDVICDERPPDVPTHTEYTLSSYDGTVHVRAREYPVVTVLNRTDVIYNSMQTNSTLLPRNYMTNLTYNCGSARNFITEAGPVVETDMTCQWNRTWTPSELLDPCDWVACVKPPTPPKSTNLRVTDWDGDPIPFGSPVRFVCKRGLMFEEDPAQEEVTYDCQDGTAPGTKKGFFNIPEAEEDWPRCLQAPLCPKPPDIPFEGVRDFVPNVFEVDPVKSCALVGETVRPKCHTFLTVYVQAASFGRQAINERELCYGQKEKDRGSPGGDCLETIEILKSARRECHGKYECSIQAEYSIANFTGCMANDLKRELKINHICGRF